ncbi:MAG: sigma factor [Jiangellaceae bacterium]
MRGGASSRERPRLLAGLARRLGDLDLAEDCLQDAATEAVVHWERDGPPANPAGWLAATARRKALDRQRRLVGRRFHRLHDR